MVEVQSGKTMRRAAYSSHLKVGNYHGNVPHPSRCYRLPTYIPAIVCLYSAISHATTYANVMKSMLVILHHCQTWHANRNTCEHRLTLLITCCLQVPMHLYATPNPGNKKGELESEPIQVQVKFRIWAEAWHQLWRHGVIWMYNTYLMLLHCDANQTLQELSSINYLLFTNIVCAISWCKHAIENKKAGVTRSGCATAIACTVSVKEKFPWQHNKRQYLKFADFPKLIQWKIVAGRTRTSNVRCMALNLWTFLPWILITTTLVMSTFSMPKLSLKIWLLLQVQRNDTSGSRLITNKQTSKQTSLLGLCSSGNDALLELCVQMSHDCKAVLFVIYLNSTSY